MYLGVKELYMLFKSNITYSYSFCYCVFVGCPSRCSGSADCLPTCPVRCCRQDLDEYMDDDWDDPMALKRDKLFN